jgi:hypothetical protein
LKIQTVGRATDRANEGCSHEVHQSGNGGLAAQSPSEHHDAAKAGRLTTIHKIPEAALAGLELLHKKFDVEKRLLTLVFGWMPPSVKKGDAAGRGKVL